jgi:hypothetical protein
MRDIADIHDLPRRSQQDMRCLRFLSRQAPASGDCEESCGGRAKELSALHVPLPKIQSRELNQSVCDKTFDSDGIETHRLAPVLIRVRK